MAARVARKMRSQGVIPFKDNVVKLLTGNFITSQGGFPVSIQCGLAGFGNGKTSGQDLLLEGGPGREIDGRRGQVGPGRQDSGPERSVIQVLNWGKSWSWDSELDSGGGDEAVSPDEVVIRVVGAQCDRGGGCPTIGREINPI